MFDKMEDSLHCTSFSLSLVDPFKDAPLSPNHDDPSVGNKLFSSRLFRIETKKAFVGLWLPLFISLAD